MATFLEFMGENAQTVIVRADAIVLITTAHWHPYPATPEGSLLHLRDVRAPVYVNERPEVVLGRIASGLSKGQRVH
jgi:hypothetical protein